MTAPNDENKVVYDSDTPSAELDTITLPSGQRTMGLLRFLIYSLIGLIVFFCSTPDGSIIFGVIYNGFTGLFGNAIYWILTAFVAANFCMHIYFKYIKKGKSTAWFADTYSNDKVLHTFLYGLGLLYLVVYAMHMTIPGFEGPEIIVSDMTGGDVIPPVVKGVLGIILVGAIFMPFLLNYGFLEIIGALLEPLMRPVFKVPGKSALDAVASFVSSSSLGVLITNRLWKKNVYTEREMVSIMTCFSAVSIGFAALVIDTADMSHHFGKLYLISFIMVFIMEAIVVRIPPISRKKDIYYNGVVQTEADRREGLKFSGKTLTTGVDRAIKRAAIAKGIVNDAISSLKDSFLILPQVLTMLSAIGVSGMILAEYTPIFNWLGYIFQPLLNICQVPEAATIAPAVPVGIAEMLLPVLVMNGTGVALPEAARAFIVLVSMVQIIFFSETATVMMATKSPIKFWEIIVCFLERTILAIPLASIAIHLFFM